MKLQDLLCTALRRLIARWLGPLLLGLACGGTAAAELRIEDLQHTRWRIEDGAPPFARAMAQTTDGALWIGTDSGLYRFDGVVFERIATPAAGGPPLGRVYALLAAADGSLWIGLGFGGVYHWKAGRFTRHAEPEGLPTGRSVLSLAAGADGSIWAATSDGLFVHRTGRWQRSGAQIGHPDRYVFQLHVDRRGTLWLAGQGGVFQLPAGAPRVQRIPLEGPGRGYFAEAPDGSLWYEDEFLRDSAGLLRLQGPDGRIETLSADVRLEPGSLRRMLVARDGSLWFMADNAVLRQPRLGTVPAPRGRAAADKPQRFGHAQGLSGYMPRLFFEDRDGHVWVSTDGGLDRFRVPRLQRLAGPGPELASLHLGDDGQPWFCDTQAGLRSLSGSAALAPQGLPHCQAVDRDAQGRRWVAFIGPAGAGLWRWGVDGAERIALPAEAGSVLAVPALQFDGAGVLWISLVRKGLFRYEGGRWSHVAEGQGGLPQDRPVTLARDGSGRLWLGYPGGQAAVMAAAGARAWGPAQGLQVGNVVTLARLGPDGMLVGGSEGLAQIVDGRVTMLRGQGGERFDGSTALVDDGNGAWWVLANAGIARVRSTDLARAAREPGWELPFERFDHADGLRGTPASVWAQPAGLRAADGRLWFSTTAGIHHIDPAALQRNPRAPVVELRALDVEGRRTALAEGLQLAAGTRRLELHFAAIHVSRPERVRYRYRLDGVDADWQTTAARNATYTNLGPGRYSFRVTAANEDGVWNEAGASLGFTIAPAFHQSAAFYALCIGGLLALAWGGHWLRLRQVAARLRLRAEAQGQERERIARDLHDTLLQSTQGLVLTVQALAERTPDGHPDKLRIVQALERADQSIRDGRRKVLELRNEGSDDDDADLAGWLGDLAGELTERGPAVVQVRSAGTPRPLQPAVRREALQIGQEALRNAQQHAQARQVELLLGYGIDAFSLQVVDDGIGIDAALMAGHTQVPGHWGLQGMRERAAALGATFGIRRDGGARTVVELVVPAAQAYVPAPAEQHAAGLSIPRSR